jgi:integrase
MVRDTVDQAKLIGMQAEDLNSYQFSYQSAQRIKASKGTVKTEVSQGRLRLRWGYAGERYCLALGLPDSQLNRTVADRKARQIEGDVATGNFDPTLEKYKTQVQQKVSQISVVKLFEQFIAEKAKEVAPKTMEKYRATLGYLQRFFVNESAASLDGDRVDAFVRYMTQNGLSPDQSRRRLEELAGCWEFGLQKNLTRENPWRLAKKRIKVPPRQKPKPFSREEIGAINHAFRSDRHYAHYADFVEFLFGTGCRTGEAIGLRWRHLNEDCSSVWIGECLTRGIRRPAKTNRARVVTMTPKLQSMLLSRRPTNANPDELVFCSPRGGAIDDHNFRNRAWKTVLTRLEIDYRKPYTTRHSLVSHALDLGMNPVMVAELTGHDVKTLYRDYAGNVSSRPMLPDL